MLHAAFLRGASSVLCRYQSQSYFILESVEARAVLFTAVCWGSGVKGVNEEKSSIKPVTVLELKWTL